MRTRSRPSRRSRLRHSPWLALMLVVAGLVTAATVGATVFGVPDLTFTPKSERQVANIDVARAQIKNYYGAPDAKTGAAPATDGSLDWTTPLNLDSNYAREARKVAKEGRRVAGRQARVKHRGDRARRRRHDADHLELRAVQQLGLQPGHERQLRRPHERRVHREHVPRHAGHGPSRQRRARALGYAVFFLTGRGDSQHAATIANLVNDTAAGLPDITSVTYSGATVPEVDAGYPPPTPLDTGHGGFADGLFTKPAVGSYPAYLESAAVLRPAIHATPAVSCPTIQYKSGTRAYIRSQGYHIVANFGDQFSDLKGGFADKTFKMPNPNYFLP